MNPNNFGQNNQYTYGNDPQQNDGGQIINYGTNVNTNTNFNLQSSGNTNFNAGFNDPNFNNYQNQNNQNTFNDPNFNNNINYNQNFNDPNFNSYNQNTFNDPNFNDPNFNNNNNNFNTFNNPYDPNMNTNFGNNNFNNFGQQNNTTFNGFTIHDEFNMRQKLMAIGMDLRLQKNGSQFGYIKQKMLSIGRTFQLQNQSGAIVAIAKEKIITIGRDFEIFDSSNKKIGSVIQEVLKSMFSFHRKYTVKDANGITIGTSKQLDIVKSTIQVINTSTGQVQAKFQQDLIHIVRDNWTVKFLGSGIDRRLLIFFPQITSQRQSQKLLQKNVNPDD